MDTPTIIDKLLAFYDRLTWQRLGQVSIVLVLTAAGIIFWKNIDYISGAIRPAKLTADKTELVISDNGKKAIDDVLTRTSTSINTIMVVRMDLERNTRRAVLFKSSDYNIQTQRDEFERTHFTTDIPAFTADPENNKRLIELINGEFVCVDWAQSNSARYLQNVNVKFVCATGVPPLYGKFRGTIVAFIKNVPDAEERTRLKIVMRDLADKLDNPSSEK